MDEARARYEKLKEVMMPDEDIWQNDFDLMLFFQGNALKFR